MFYCLCFYMHYVWGHFEWRTRGNAVRIVEKLSKRVFPLLKRLRTHHWWHCEPFSVQKCTRLQGFLHIQYLDFSEGDTPLGSPQKRPRCLDPHNNFRLACQRSHCSCFTKRPLEHAQCTVCNSKLHCGVYRVLRAQNQRGQTTLVPPFQTKDGFPFGGATLCGSVA